MTWSSNWPRILREGPRQVKLAPHSRRQFELASSDDPTPLYRERCKAYLSDPPPPDWDGVYTMQSESIEGGFGGQKSIDTDSCAGPI